MKSQMTNENCGEFLDCFMILLQFLGYIEKLDQGKAEHNILFYSDACV